MNTVKKQLIIPVGLKPKPTADEIAVAETLAEHFQSNVEFVLCGVSHTPDINHIAAKRIIIISKSQKVVVMK